MSDGIHSVDPETYFCTKCGLGLSQILSLNNIPCLATANVIDISHIIARNRMTQILAGPQPEKL